MILGFTQGHIFPAFNLLVVKKEVGWLMEDLLHRTSPVTIVEENTSKTSVKIGHYQRKEGHKKILERLAFYSQV